MTSQPNISVVIVSYNTREFTLRCLDALFAATGIGEAEIFVVDNASSDGSATAIRDRFPHVEVIENATNKGFGAANNVAMARATGRYLLLLNSDAFIDADTLAHLTDYLHRHAAAGVVGPRLLNSDGSLQVSCFRFPSPFRVWVENLWISALLHRHRDVGDYRRWPHDEEREVDWVHGACLLARAEVYRAVGGFDERFFMYAEETDWQRRIRNAGWTIGFCPAARVTHVGGASGAFERPRINRHFFDSLDRYERKHHGVAGLIWLRLWMFIGCGLRAIGWTLVLAFLPNKRSLAVAKVKLLAWLTVRQACYWPRRVGIA